MIVSVTKDHIKRGKRLDCQECPIALALLDATGENFVAVGTRISVGYFNRYVATRSCLRFIRKFDNGDKVKPFNFRLVEE